MGSAAYAVACNLPPAEIAGPGSWGVCTDRLDRLGMQLQQTSRQVEDAVVEVCDSFNNIALRARAETARLVRLLAPADPQAENRSFEHLLRSCSGTLRQLLEMQSKSNEMMAAAVSRLRQVDEAASKIEQAVVLLEQISHGNRLLALNARIEASRLPEYERGFNAVAVELSAQTTRTNQLTDEVANLSGFLKGLADATVHDLQHMHADSAKTGVRIRNEANQTLEGLSDGYRSMREAVSQSQTESSLLADEIAVAIRGMQFQDRVSQQIAHVVHDLNVVQQLIVQRSSGLSEPPDGAAGFSDMVMHEERAIYGSSGPESLEGDIELF